MCVNVFRFSMLKTFCAKDHLITEDSTEGACLEFILPRRGLPASEIEIPPQSDTNSPDLVEGGSHRKMMHARWFSIADNTIAIVWSLQFRTLARRLQTMEHVTARL